VKRPDLLLLRKQMTGRAGSQTLPDFPMARTLLIACSSSKDLYFLSETDEEASFITRERRRIRTGFQFRGVIKLAFTPECQEKTEQIVKKLL
jgi:hypothetical protein